ncbi:MAG TPA: BON domain-containing protein [Microvirga sp.]|jgi:hypothetical protein|nr:BON domain-containing protein [Microvirga sp.]
MINVEVGADTPDLAESIREAVPRANVKVESINGRTRLTGTVPDAIALRKILELAAQYGDNVVNALRVTGGQQVMLEVRFVEVNRSVGRELRDPRSGYRSRDHHGSLSAARDACAEPDQHIQSKLAKRGCAVRDIRCLNSWGGHPSRHTYPSP